MPDLLSADTAFAGFFGPQAIISATGIPQPSLPVAVTTVPSNADATLYTDQTKAATTGSNTVDTDSLGNLFFYADPGYYKCTCVLNGVTTVFYVFVPPWYPDASSNVVAGITSATAMLSGSSYYVASGSPTLTAPNPVVGARFRVTNQGSGAPTVGQFGSELFKWPGFSVGVTSLPFAAPGATMTCEFDGTYWNVIAGAPDTGDIGVAAINANAVAAGGNPPTNRLIGNLVRLGGGISVTGPIAPTGAYITLQANMVPLINKDGFSSYFDTTAVPEGLIVNTAGEVSTPSNLTLGIGNFVYFSGISFTVDG